MQRASGIDSFKGPLSARRPLGHPETADRTVVSHPNQLLSISMNAPTPRVDELRAHEVVCLHTDPAAEADGHVHVSAIETRDPDGGRSRWTLVQVIAAVREGEAFHAGKGSDGRAGVLEPAVCPRCPFATLVVDPPEARPSPCS